MLNDRFQTIDSQRLAYAIALKRRLKRILPKTAQTARIRQHERTMLDSIFLTCPFCGERFEALVDASGGEADYVEDCPVCCRPIHMHLHTGPDGELESLDADRDE